MTFSIQSNPYLSMYQQPPGLSSDCVLPRKTTAFRESLPSRLHGIHGLDLVNSILASCRVNKTKSDITSQPNLTYPPLNPFLASPSWFQQALVNSLLLPRPFVDDTCLPVPPTRQPDLGVLIPPKIPRPMPSSPVTSKSRTSSCDSLMRTDTDIPDPMVYCRSTFYPLLKDQANRAHSSWQNSDPPKNITFEPISETGTLVPSLIDGEVIMGFNVWGEKRLCLPHLFRFVLNDVDLKAIDEACTKLQITCTTCTPAQLKLLHARRILPKAVSTCGLIRKSDAERLTKFIRNRMDPVDRSQVSARPGPVTSCSHSGDELEVLPSTHGKQPYATPSHSATASIKDPGESSENHPVSLSFSSDNERTQKRDSSSESLTQSSEHIPVLHECFGRQSGLIHPELYTEPAAKCIECQTCHRLFAPDQFVGHTHTVTEVDNLNHWGFDSNNWRCYLRLYTGRQGRGIKPNTRESQSADGSEDEMDNITKDYTITAETHRRLEEFKIKFAQPIRLPPSLSAALRTVGLCASVAPIPPNSMIPLNPMHNLTDTRTPCAPNLPVRSGPINKLRPPAVHKDLNNTSTTVASLTSPASTATSSPIPPTIPSSLSSVILPQLTLRRLWAPNDGRIKVPPPPKPMATRDQSVLPKKLHTGPPILLHSHRVVSQAAADQYDRDFIPNVCLMSPIGAKCRKSSCGSHSRHNHRHLSQDCACRRGSYMRSRNLSSGSRSRSRSYSSGSSSSRTRSVSASSTTSSCYSRGRSCKHPDETRLFSPCSHGSRSSSTASSIHVEESDSPCSDKINSCICASGKPLSDSSVLSDSSSSREGYLQRSRRLRCARRRYRSASSVRNNVPVPIIPRRVRSASPVVCISFDQSCVRCQNAKLQRMAKISTCSTTSCLKTNSSPAQSEQSCSERHQRRRHHRHQHHNRALAAAKAAQGAASRISPGLWSRHFANLKGSNTGTLELPNARESVSSASTGLNPLIGNTRSSLQPNNNTTPVLVTSPNTNSLPSAVLALESIWTDLVSHINEYTTAVESRTGVQNARQRLFEQFLSMQTCYATHIAALLSENQKLHEKLASIQSRKSDALSTNSSELQNKIQPTVQNWTRKDSGNFKNDASNNAEPSNTKSFQASQPLYPHRSRKEPQPTRTQFSTTYGSSGVINTNSDMIPNINYETTRSPTDWPHLFRSSKLSMPSSQTGNISDATVPKIHQINSVDKVGSERMIGKSMGEDAVNHSKQMMSATREVVAAKNEAVNVPRPTAESQHIPSDLDSGMRSQSFHGSSTAPYKVSSGLYNRRLSEKYNIDCRPWKRRIWEIDEQAECNGTLDLSIQSSEPVQKRRAVSITDDNS